MAINKWLLMIHKWTMFYFVRFLFSLKGRGNTVKPVQNKQDILNIPATDLAVKIRTKQITSAQVLQLFIDRIHEINPILNCVVDECYGDAMRQATEVDRVINSGEFTEDQLARDKPFYGVPISTKDCIAVKGLLHTAGLVSRKNVRADKDSDAMALMRKAGAIPFALTNVSECCMWWESHNRVHGRTNNAYDTNRIVGGSSGGEGCLLSASGSPFGLGSDIGGSIRMPSFFNGIFGHKPSKSIVSNVGQWPVPQGIQMDFLGLGPMSRYAKDLKPVLKIIAGDNADKLRLDEPIDIKKVKIFYQYSDGGADLISDVDPDIKSAMQRIVDHFDKLSNEKPKCKQIKLLKKSLPIWMGNMKSPPGVDDFNSQLLNLKGKINPYTEIIKWLFGQSNHTLIAILTVISESVGVKYGSSKHQSIVNQKVELIKEFNDMLGETGVFLYPTHPTAAPYHNEPIARAFNFSYTGIVNTLSLPATAVPMGLGREGLPIGIQIIGNLNQDRLCLEVACEIERQFGGWVEPGKSTST